MGGSGLRCALPHQIYPIWTGNKVIFVTKLPPGRFAGGTRCAAAVLFSLNALKTSASAASEVALSCGDIQREAKVKTQLLSGGAEHRPSALLPVQVFLSTGAVLSTLSPVTFLKPCHPGSSLHRTVPTGDGDLRQTQGALCS